MPEDKPYYITLSFNVLNHLGLNLYSNVPAVIGEVVANSWDADAKIVDIEIDRKDKKVVIIDDGHGMTHDEINQKYLLVGYNRRASEKDRFSPGNRPVMGRKGIGKLSLFSIAREIEVYTVKDGQKNGFRMVLEDIEKKLKAKSTDTYYPDPINEKNMDIDKGTKVILMNLKKTFRQTESALRKRLARHFSIIGQKHNFSVRLNGSPITIEDRNYFHKVQYLWSYGDLFKEYLPYCKKLKKLEKRSTQVPGKEFGAEDNYVVKGWIGTVEKSGDLKDGEDNLNKILVLVRGKLAQEDILEEFSEGGVYTKYLIGEINADFLDIDTEEDIATSSRQKIKEDDPRYRALRGFVLNELKNIQKSWTDLRNLEGEKKALEIPAIQKWFKTLKGDNKKRAKSVFGRINQLTVDSEKDRRLLFQYGVMAFESLRYKQNLDALEKISPDNFEALSEIFGDLDDIEATLYHQIVSERIEVIDKLRQAVDDNVREKIIQEHIFEHLWLLDTSWDRATETPIMEQSVKKEFDTINAKLKPEEERGRVDVKYKAPSGKHIIIELKRANVKTSAPEIIAQTTKYRNALRKLLREVNKEREPIEVVCIVGKELAGWEDPTLRKEDEESLRAKGTRVVMYQELIENAYQEYKNYLEKKKEAGRIYELIRSIDTEEIFEET